MWELYAFVQIWGGFRLELDKMSRTQLVKRRDGTRSLIKQLEGMADRMDRELSERELAD